MNSPQEAKPPITRQCEVAPEYIITNIRSKYKSQKEYFGQVLRTMKVEVSTRVWDNTIKKKREIRGLERTLKYHGGN